MTDLRQIQTRGGTAAVFASSNPVLLAREEVIETDTGRRKIGDGTTRYNALPYQQDPDVLAALVAAAAANAALAATVALKADQSVSIAAGTGLTGGGDLSQGRTLSVVYGNTAGTAVRGDDTRLLMPTGTKTAAYTAAAGEAIPVNATNGPIPVTLPTAPAAGALVFVGKIDATGNIVHVAPAAGGSIDGDTGGADIVTRAGAVFQHTGSNAWQIIGATASIGSVSSVVGQTGAITGAQIVADSTVAAALTAKAPLASPALTGVPTVPTAAADTATTQAASTAFVLGQAGTLAPLIDGTAAAGTSPRLSRQDHVHPTDATRAPLASPALTGTPTVPTATAGTSTTQAASTAFVGAALATQAATDLGTYTKPVGATVALVGTSITNNLGTIGGYQFNNSYWGWANVLLGHRFDLISIDGVVGSGCTNPGFQARIDAVAAGPATWVCIEALTNDIAGGQTLAAIQAAITAALVSLRSAGKRTMLLTSPPRTGLTGGQQTVWGQVNTWIRQLPVSYPGLVVVNVDAYLTDPTSSTPATYAAGYASDGIHPTPAGGKQMGLAFQAALAGIVPPCNLLGAQWDSANLLTYPKASWAGGASGYPSSWTGTAAGATWQQVARTDGVQGIVQRVIVPPGSSCDLHTPIGAYAVGDRLVGYVEVLGTFGVDTAPAANSQWVNVYLQAYTPAFGNAGIVSELYPNGTQPNVAPPTGPHVLQTPVLTIPANGLTETDFFIGIHGGATYDLGRVGVLKVGVSY